MCVEALTLPRSVADRARTTMTASDPATRNAWLAVSGILPFAVVEQPLQSTRATGGAPFLPLIRSDAVTGPLSDGRLNFQLSRHPCPTRGTTVAVPWGGRALLARRPLNRPAAVVPVTGASRA
jgi:hypothetical protein